MAGLFTLSFCTHETVYYVNLGEVSFFSACPSLNGQFRIYPIIKTQVCLSDHFIHLKLICVTLAGDSVADLGG